MDGTAGVGGTAVWGGGVRGQMESLAEILREGDEVS